MHFTSEGWPRPEDVVTELTKVHKSSSDDPHSSSSYTASASAPGPMFLSGPAADGVLQRQKRYNTGIFEELLKGNLERECIKERCDFEEAREIFENDEKTNEFWAGYVDGNQCEPNPCLNQGTCKDHIGFYTCKCGSDFTGKNCEIVIAKRCDINNGDCMHFCETVEDSVSQCSCATGYKLMVNGLDCEPEVAFPCGKSGPGAVRPVARRSLRDSDKTNAHNTTSLTEVVPTANHTKASSAAGNDSAKLHSLNKLPQWVHSEAEEPTEYPTEDYPTEESPPEEQPHPYKRIVGGTVVTPGEIPWQVALISRSSGQVFCGGSILSKRWVITAAHCLVESQGHFSIRVGEHNVYIKEGPEQEYEVLKQHIYPHYNATVSPYNHDIALLYTKKPITFSTAVRPICIGPKSFTEPLLRMSSPATVSGWGRTRYLGSTADTLQKVQVPFTDRTQCTHSSSARITRYMFCAGYSNQARDACQGDSGGPHANIVRDTWFLTGIVSWGEECARDGKYGVYTHVSYYYYWINQVMGVTKHRLALNVDNLEP